MGNMDRTPGIVDASGTVDATFDADPPLFEEKLAAYIAALLLHTYRTRGSRDCDFSMPAEQDGVPFHLKAREMTVTLRLRPGEPFPVVLEAPA